MTSTLSAPAPHHHGHFAHHVRTKGWGIEPGWKIVNHNIEAKTKVPKNHHVDHPVLFDHHHHHSNSPLLNSQHLRRSFRLPRETNKDRFTHFENGIGRIGPPRSSSFRDQSAPPAPSSTSSTSSNSSSSSSSGRNIEIKLIGPVRTASKSYEFDIPLVDNVKEQRCPMHQHDHNHYQPHQSRLSYFRPKQPLEERRSSDSNSSSSVRSRSSPPPNPPPTPVNLSFSKVMAIPQNAVIPRSQPEPPHHHPQSHHHRQSLPRSSFTFNNILSKNNLTDSKSFPVRSSFMGGSLRVKHPDRHSDRVSYASSEASVPQQQQQIPLMPPGVLKKPGVNRNGPKHMKKVAFLENAEFSRGIP